MGAPLRPIDELALILVHRDQPDACLASLAAFSRSDVALRVVVVDNGSRADLLDRLRAGLPDDVRLLELGSNTGFGPGANAGLRWALDTGAGLVAVAPHDALPEPDCLRLLVDALADRPRAGLVSADVGDAHRPYVDPYFGGITLPRRREVGWECCDYAHGTLFVARTACLREIGLFDERYFAYCEEADLGLRVRRAGWQVGIVHGARVRNPQLGTPSAAADYLMTRNTLLLVREHYGRYRATVRSVILLGQVLHGTLAPGSRPWIFSARGRVRGLGDHLRGRYGAPPESLLAPDPARVPAVGAHG